MRSHVVISDGIFRKDALHFMKVECLALGMLNCMKRGFDLLAEHKGIAGKTNTPIREETNRSQPESNQSPSSPTTKSRTLENHDPRLGAQSNRGQNSPLRHIR
jgi:hypothetical protein